MTFAKEKECLIKCISDPIHSSSAWSITFTVERNRNATPLLKKLAVEVVGINIEREIENSPNPSYTHWIRIGNTISKFCTISCFPVS